MHWDEMEQDVPPINYSTRIRRDVVGLISCSNKGKLSGIFTTDCSADLRTMEVVLVGPINTRYSMHMFCVQIVLTEWYPFEAPSIT